jgi:hypothetical protein
MGDPKREPIKNPPGKSGEELSKTRNHKTRRNGGHRPILHLPTRRSAIPRLLHQSRPFELGTASSGGALARRDSGSRG